jgi:hypothetical protein
VAVLNNMPHLTRLAVIHCDCDWKTSNQELLLTHMDETIHIRHLAFSGCTGLTLQRILMLPRMSTLAALTLGESPHSHTIDWKKCFTTLHALTSFSLRGTFNNEILPHVVHAPAIRYVCLGFSRLNLKDTESQPSLDVIHSFLTNCPDVALTIQLESRSEYETWLGKGSHCDDA